MVPSNFVKASCVQSFYGVELETGRKVRLRALGNFQQSLFCQALFEKDALPLLLAFVSTLLVYVKC